MSGPLFEATYDDNGALDQLSANAPRSVVLERMSAGAWQLRVTTADGSAVFVELESTSIYVPVRAVVWTDGQEPAAPHEGTP